MSEDKKYIESAMRRMLGATEEHKKLLHDHYDPLECEVNCWNCGKRLTCKLSALATANCPHCGVNLAKRA